ncbi:MAG: alpha/beta hydrolase fold domain-containing protein [Planctomycetota bacterium]
MLVSPAEISATEAIYRQTPQGPLALKIYQPPDLEDDDRRPAMVLYHGSGWIKGSINHFEPYARWLASRGMVVVTPAYRIRDEHGTTPFDAMDDAFVAFAWVRDNAERLHIDPAWLAAGGGSAGGGRLSRHARISAADGGGRMTGLALTAALLSAEPKPPDEPPNVLVILADDFGWMDLSIQGSEFYETPHIDELMARGTRPGWV